MMHKPKFAWMLDEDDYQEVILSLERSAAKCERDAYNGNPFASKKANRYWRRIESLKATHERWLLEGWLEGQYEGMPT